ncbi:predicted protein [Coccidioides posadasii str. Silveira]|uniref:Predicted protein n=1 Tax=Coccidioides posadasii (strain RMSCC 757 / Silveira) TaxID=443226 RepID=E9D7U2_COCPS|nr:predicted protein [Coccidioides posadasii str. Silveira]
MAICADRFAKDSGEKRLILVKIEAARLRRVEQGSHPSKRRSLTRPPPLQQMGLFHDAGSLRAGVAASTQMSGGAADQTKALASICHSASAQHGKRPKGDSLCCLRGIARNSADWMWASVLAAHAARQGRQQPEVKGAWRGVKTRQVMG